MLLLIIQSYFRPKKIFSVLGPRHVDRFYFRKKNLIWTEYVPKDICGKREIMEKELKIASVKNK